MKIIATTDLSKPTSGECNPKIVRKSITIVEDFGMYTVITAEKTIAPNSTKIYCRNVTCDFDEAKYYYELSGGVFPEIMGVPV